MFLYFFYFIDKGSCYLWKIIKIYSIQSWLFVTIVWSNKVTIYWLCFLIYYQGGAIMKYINANVILPEKLIEEIQKYIQGKYIYIPIKKENYKSWG